MRKQMLPVILLGVTVVISFSGCNSGVGTGTSGSFSSCYAIGFSNPDITSIYNAAVTDRANGATYNEEGYAATNACIEGCNYEGVCANGCASCAHEIINDAYSKLLEQPAKSLGDQDSTIADLIVEKVKKNVAAD